MCDCRFHGLPPPVQLGGPITGLPLLAGAGAGAGRDSGGKKRRTLALRMFDMLRRKRDEVMPGVVSHFPNSGLGMKEKI